jgi:hypothetical protein
MKKEWVKEIARDLIALGGIPFFILVIVRVFILPDYHYIFQFVFGGILFFILNFLFKSNNHSGLGIILLFFVSKHYGDIKFTILASIMYLLLIVSLFYLKEDKIKVFKGIFFGTISIIISYFLTGLIFGF